MVNHVLIHLNTFPQWGRIEPRVIPDPRTVLDVALDELLSRREPCQRRMGETPEVLLHDGLAFRRHRLLPVPLRGGGTRSTEVWCHTNHDHMGNVGRVL